MSTSDTNPTALGVAPRYPAPSAVLALLKPITWFPPMWAYACGAVAVGGAAVLDRWEYVAAGVVLAGPLVCGTSQAVNDWYDRHVDAINEPDRVIPSGRMPGSWGLYIAIIGSVLSLIVANFLGQFVLGATLVGLFFAWIYSMPPLRLKQNGWFGNAAVGFSYESLPWVTAAAAALGAAPDMSILSVAFLYGLGAHGIMTLNDFKSVVGDTQMGLKSLPVQLGVDRAAKLACVVMAAPQAIVIALLIYWGAPLYAAAVAVLLAAQGACMVRLLRDPFRNAIWYNAVGTSLYVLGMMVAAAALNAIGAGAQSGAL